MKDKNFELESAGCKPDPAPREFIVKAVYLGYNIPGNNISATIEEALAIGYNLLLLAFWNPGSPPVEGAAKLWENLPKSEKRRLVAIAEEQGAEILVSVGGAGFSNYNYNASSYGEEAAAFAQENELHGIDFDLEHLTANSLPWLVEATTAAKSNFIGSTITHAPQSSYFRLNTWDYLYRKVYAALPEIIDYYLIQYYNQGYAQNNCERVYGTYEDQFIASRCQPETAVRSLINPLNTGSTTYPPIPKGKIVIGRTMQPADGMETSWVNPSCLGKWFNCARTDSRIDNWHTGFSTWQWHATGTPNALTWYTNIFDNPYTGPCPPSTPPGECYSN